MVNAAATKPAVVYCEILARLSSKHKAHKDFALQLVPLCNPLNNLSHTSVNTLGLAGGVLRGGAAVVMMKYGFLLWQVKLSVAVAFLWGWMKSSAHTAAV